ncbi:MAG: SOS response-associated peptidase, partial [Candidatus Binatia bacterium]
MCGRFTQTFDFREIKIRWNIQRDLEFPPRYNIAPSQKVPVIVKGESGNDAKLMKWGLVPFWAPDPSIGNRMINARSETLMEKPSFKRLVEQRRCLVPADGFYEWRRGKQKFPMLIRLKNKEPFAFAGLWDAWRNPQLPEDVLQTFTIITTEPNAMLKHIHNRMPVIYDEPMGRQWLEGVGSSSSMKLDAILRPMPAHYMEAYEVSKMVNAPANDRLECVQPTP